MIIFETSDKPRYDGRTKTNVLNSDLTIAIASDFDSAGEVLTRNICLQQRKGYLAIPFGAKVARADVLNAFAQIKFFANLGTTVVVNIAGNGLHTLVTRGDYRDDKLIQRICDDFVFLFLTNLLEELAFSVYSIEMIRSGGQTGFDEAGLKAAIKLGIPALCHGPSDWRFRPGDGIDICDEQKFKARFD